MSLGKRNSGAVATSNEGAYIAHCQSAKDEEDDGDLGIQHDGDNDEDEPQHHH